MRIQISALMTTVLLMSGCNNIAPSPEKKINIEQTKTIYSKEESDLLQSLSLLKENNAKMLTQDAVYANHKQAAALIENKKSDVFSSKPLFLEPLFAKIEIMPYETKSGIYHEQQSVWVKVKEGEIVMKSNSDTNLAVDSLKNTSVLMK